jgi:hypothetical protein
MYGLDVVRDRLQTGRLRFLPGVNAWHSYREMYVWKPIEGEDENAPESWEDKPKKPQPAEHMMDATRYLCTGLEEYGGAVPMGDRITVFRKNAAVI